MVLASVSRFCAAGDEQQSLLQGGIVFLRPGGFQSFDQEGRVGHIGAGAAAIARAAVSGVGAFQPLAFVPLQFPQVLARPFDRLVVLAFLAGLAEGQ